MNKDSRLLDPSERVRMRMGKSDVSIGVVFLLFYVDDGWDI